MQKQLLTLLCILSILGNSYAQRNYWSSVEEQNLKVNQEDIIEYDMVLKKAVYFQLDKTSLSSQLNMAPYRENSATSNVNLIIPDQKGGFETYEMFKVQTLAPQLAQNYPNIQSYVGRRTDKRDASILRITITPHGFYAMVKKPDVGQLFINPYDKNGDYYMSFLKSSAQDSTSLTCEVNSVDGFGMDISDVLLNDSDYETFTVDDSTLRTYDLALACTGEYAQFHINQAGLGGASTADQISAILAAMVVSIDRVNSIYEIDLGVTLQIIPNNDQLIYLNASTDPYTNSNGGAMLNQNQNNVDSVIGSSNYDIGHVFSTGGGGIAALGSICVNGQKAAGVTGGPNPVGDPFDVDFVSHEIGHQFGANHTQNNSCQRNQATAVEPGSASTIMGYAGICTPNVQNNSDAYFHQVSINQIYNNISGSSGSTCGNFGTQSNTAPTFTPVPNYTIPNGTAFYLDINAVDAENDPLTFNWEQFNNDISTQPPSPTSTGGPNFRSLPSSSESRRYFPSFSDVLNNNLTPTWEVIPSVARSMNFVVTIRDNNVLVGQSSRDIVIVNFASVGPFQVTSQNTSNINWLPGETRTVTWDVAGTNANGINTSNVNILLSTDGGLTFGTTLASNVANDGSEDITVPSLQAPFCRIMVEPVDNVYYALNSTSFAIDTNVTNTCETNDNLNPVAIPDGAGPNQQGPAVSSVINIPNDISNIDDINITLDVSHTYINDLVFQMQAPSGDIILLWARNCDSEDAFTITFNDSGATLPSAGSTCANPLTGSFAPASTSTDLSTIFSNGTSGNWTLQFADFYNGDTGTLNSWEIEICSTTFSVEDNQINNFSIYPNPNNGSFNLSFSQAIDSNSEISLYDIQGRLIEKLDFDPNALTQRIQLNNQYQSGVYLVEVANSKGKFVKKLIIR